MILDAVLDIKDDESGEIESSDNSGGDHEGLSDSCGTGTTWFEQTCRPGGGIPGGWPDYDRPRRLSNRQQSE
jgi:hypothetical protein